MRLTAGICNWNCVPQWLAVSKATALVHGPTADHSRHDAPAGDVLPRFAALPDAGTPLTYTSKENSSIRKLSRCIRELDDRIKVRHHVCKDLTMHDTTCTMQPPEALLSCSDECLLPLRNSCQASTTRSSHAGASRVQCACYKAMLDTLHVLPTCTYGLPSLMLTRLCACACCRAAKWAGGCWTAAQLLPSSQQPAAGAATTIWWPQCSTCCRPSTSARRHQPLTRTRLALRSRQQSQWTSSSQR